jgi:hypothetical protein
MTVMTAPDDTTAWEDHGAGGAETGVVPPPVETVAAVELAWSSADDSGDDGGPVHQSWLRAVFQAAVLVAVGVVLAEAIWAAHGWVAQPRVPGGPVVVAAPSPASTQLMSPLPTSGPATTVTVTAQPPAAAPSPNVIAQPAPTLWVPPEFPPEYGTGPPTTPRIEEADSHAICDAFDGGTPYHVVHLIAVHRWGLDNTAANRFILQAVRTYCDQHGELLRGAAE